MMRQGNRLTGSQRMERESRRRGMLVDRGVQELVLAQVLLEDQENLDPQNHTLTSTNSSYNQSRDQDHSLDTTVTTTGSFDHDHHPPFQPTTGLLALPQPELASPNTAEMGLSHMFPSHLSRPVNRTVNSRRSLRPSFDGTNDRLPGVPTYRELLQENKMLKINTLELQIVQCRNLCLIDRFVQGQLNNPENGPPSGRQMLLQEKIEELEARLAELRGRPLETTSG
ncbi:hypothetical protein TWF281_007472 [Arthrobotrys megalospora]